MAETTQTDIHIINRRTVGRTAMKGKIIITSEKLLYEINNATYSTPDCSYV